MNLQQIVDNVTFKGIIVLSDLHGVISSLESAIEYAESNNLFIVMLGDLFDSGNHPMECVTKVHDLLETKKAVLVKGNHESKMYRYSIGNPVTLNGDQIATLESVGKERVPEFFEIVQTLFNHPRASMYFYYGKTIMAHAAVHITLWDKPESVSGVQIARCFYGETDGTEYKGLPNRTYKWLDNIPPGHSTVTGHDRSANGKPLGVPMVARTSQGGTAYLTDTSCGKEPGYPLTGTVFDIVDNEMCFNTFKSFV